MIEEAKRLRHLLSMPRAELISRENAWSDVVAAGQALLAAIGADPEPLIDPIVTPGLIDAQTHGQADPVTRTVAIKPPKE